MRLLCCVAIHTLLCSLVDTCQTLNNAAEPWELDRRIQMQEGHQLGESPPASVGALCHHLQPYVIYFAACAQPWPRQNSAPRAHVAISSGFVQHVHRLLTHVSLLQGLWGVNTTVLLMVFSETIGVLLNKTQPKAAKFMVDQGHPQRKPELVGVKASAEGKPRSHGHCCTAVAWLRQQ